MSSFPKVHKRLSAKMIIEYIRMEYMITTGDKYKINNSYTSYYVRLFPCKRIPGTETDLS